MVGTRTGHIPSLQGPHDILMAEVQVINPAGIHTLILQDDNRHTGTLREWNRQYTKPNHMQKRLLEMWKQERSWEESMSDKWCVRSHRRRYATKWGYKNVIFVRNSCIIIFSKLFQQLLIVLVKIY